MSISESPNGFGLDDAVYNRLLHERIIFVGTEVDNQLANRVCAQLLLLAAEDAKRDINLWINSPGGVVDAGMAIYDTMQFIGNDVATVAMGMAASMGQLLLTAGTAGKRYALPHARIMMHQPHGGIGGVEADVAIQAEQMIFTKRTIRELIAQHSGQSTDQIEADFDRDRWFTSADAVDYGLIDHVVVGARQLRDSAGGF